MRLTCVDIGIVHLAFVDVEVDAAAEVPRIRAVHDLNLVDITAFQHYRVARSCCGLHHGNNLTDRVAHFAQEYSESFEEADAVLIEQQPPGGHQAVEQLLFQRYRDKAHLVSPVGMHAFLGMRELTYEGRKAHVVRHVEGMRWLTPAQWERLRGFDREHDVCDALCLLSYWVSKHLPDTGLVPPPPAPKTLRLSDGTSASVDEFFRQFAFRPRPCA